MRLRDMTADQISEELERREQGYFTKEGEFVPGYLQAVESHDRQKSAHEALSAGLYDVFRRTDKMSIEDAKRALWTVEAFRDSEEEVRKAKIEELKAKMAVDRAKSALDLWRTEAANMRRVG